MKEGEQIELVRLARLNYRRGDFDESIFYLNQVLEEVPYSFSANKCLAKIYFEKGEKLLAYNHLALSEAELFRGGMVDKYGTLENFLEDVKKRYEGQGIESISVAGFD